MMNRMGMKTSVYDGEMCLGELEAVNERNSFQFPNNKILIHHFSPQSDRCAPLAILQTISPYSVICKLESSVPYEQPHLINLHSTCFYQSKTAVILVGDEEIHMVAMPSRQKKFPCFWCCSAPKGLYAASLGMLNPRCLAIVFDLDETLIVANTNKSFEDKIEGLKPWIARETDPHKHSMMVAELKRLMDERALLKMYSENDSVKLMDNGNVVKAQMEEVPPLSDSQDKLVRPVIRLPEKNLVLTRINPEVRDTSVLVRLRPAWDDLRNYLNAKGRKRFEVYVCTMAERDYALEMWRLLDPEAHLINLKQLPDRVCCVKAGSKKSLLNVFQSGVCHPKMGMVIDDRIKVWEDRDQPRVHVVPQFAPYFAPHAETAHPVPVLCVARNVACNVRGWFYREFDESFLRKIVETLYEDDVGNLPQAPDVSNFMVSEDAGFIPNGNSHAPIAEGMSGAEVERRIIHSDGKKVVDPAPQSMNFTANSRAVVAQPVGPVLPNPVGLKSSGNLLPSQKGVSHNQASSNTRELQNGSGRTNPDPSPPFISVLQYIGRVCDVKIEFRPVISTSHHVQFTVEVLYEGEKIGVGMGKTRKGAQQQAAENALHFLADGYNQYMMSVAGAAEATDPDTISLGNENGFLMDVDDSGKDEVLEQELAKESTFKIRSGGCLARNHSLFGFFSTPRSVSPYNGGGMS